MDPTACDQDPRGLDEEVCGCAAGGAVAGAAGGEVGAFHDADVHLHVSRHETADGPFLRVKATAPEEGKRKPIVLLAILDNSGSMSESAGTMQGAENIAFTRMDLVKHAVRTMAALLGPADRLGIVSFSTEARKVLDPICMTAEGRDRIAAALATVNPDSSTNIFAGIKEAAAMANRSEFADANVVAMLLTDGFPTISPPRGVVQSLKLGGAGLTRPWTLSTYGFGYSLDSALLAEVAEWGGGAFGFIPDCSMVGTVFINAIAHLLTTANRGITYRVEGAGEAGGETSFATGPIAFGQPRVLYHPLVGESLRVVYEGRVVGTGGDEESDEEEEPALAHHDLLHTLRSALVRCKANAPNEAQALMELFYERHRASGNKIVQAFCKDLSPVAGEEGQVHMAPAYFRRWGEHYLRAYLRAQELQQCMNFKDAGLQVYGGDMFHRLQDEGDRLFCTLPPPVPTGRGGYGSAAAAATGVNMSLFLNASAGCFAGGTQILLADGSQQPIASIEPGTLVATPTGLAAVQALVTCRTQQRSQPMTQLGDLWITPWHPVRMNGIWQFPAQFAGCRERLLQVVYNLVLSSGHIVYAEGYEACTLAHGFTDSPVVQHDFFGTERVLQDLAQVPGWEVGRPTFQNLVAIRDETTDVICGWRDMPF